ncbi:MAG TPA: tetratricopeptide repeat protein [Acidobacteriota bacterium]|jgi:tetratricopeptide (TPR) repeat protein
MRFLVWLLTALLSFLALKAQTLKHEELSHVERFNPRLRDARIERERTAALQANPNDPAALNDRGVARIHLGKFKEAIDDLQRGALLDARSADLRVSLGYALWRSARTAEAAESFREALRLDEKHFPAHYYLGRLLLIGGRDPSEAAAHLQRAVEVNPEAYEVRFDLIAAYRALGDATRARAQLRFLEAEMPAEPRVLYASALLAADREDWKNAIESYRAALRGDPTLPGAGLELGMALIKSARWTEAAEWFAQLAKQQPQAVDPS